MMLARRGRMFVRLLRGSLFSRGHRLILAVSAIAIGTSVAAALLLVSLDVGHKVSRDLRAFGPNLVLVPRGEDLTVGSRRLALGTVDEAPRLGAPEAAWLGSERAAGRLAAAAPVLYAVARVGERSIVVAGVDDFGELRALYPTWRWSVLPGARAANANLGRTAAEWLDVTAGRDATIELLTPSGPRAFELRPREIFDAGGAEDRYAFVRRSELARALGLSGEAESAFHLAVARAAGSPEEVLAYAGRPLPAGTFGELRAVKQLSAADGEVLERLRLLLVMVTVVALVAAALCAMSTLYDLVLERTREIALLRSLGAARGEVVALFLAEACAVGVAGGVAGLGIGLVAAQAIGRGVFGTTVGIAPIVPPAVLALAVITALVASVGPVLRALAIDPAGALRGD